MTAPSAEQLSRYRYHFTDMRTGAYLGTLPLLGAEFDDVLSGPGPGQGSVPLAGAEVREQQPWAATIPRRSVCWAEREVLDPATGSVLSASVPWAGPVMSRKRSRTGRLLELGMVSWPGYFARRLVRLSRTFTQVDKFTIHRWLMAQALYADPDTIGTLFMGYVAGLQLHPDPQTAAGSWLNGPVSGVLADRTYLEADLKPVLEAQQQLAATGLGYDWTFRYYRDPTARQRFYALLDLGYPRLGRTLPADLTWSSDQNETRYGQMLDYSFTEDGSAANNHLVGLGAGTGPLQLRSHRYLTSELDYGWPLYEDSLKSSTQELTTQASLDEHVTAAVASSAASAIKLEGITVRGDLAPTADTYSPGDDATLVLGDDLGGANAVAGYPIIAGQIVGRKLYPPEQGRAEHVSLTVQGRVVI